MIANVHTWVVNSNDITVCVCVCVYWVWVIERKGGKIELKREREIAECGSVLYLK